MKESHSIVFFDEVCNLCNTSVSFILKHNRKRNFKFSSLQSDFALKTLPTNLTKKLESIILIENNKCYTSSSAVLKISKSLNFPFNLFYIFIIIPNPLRDFTYNWIARNRYHWFGKTNTCRVPTEEESEYFIK